MVNVSHTKVTSMVRPEYQRQNNREGYEGYICSFVAAGTLPTLWLL